MHILAQGISSPTISSTWFKWKEWRAAYAKTGKNGISIPLGSGISKMPIMNMLPSSEIYCYKRSESSILLDKEWLERL